MRSKLVAVHSSVDYVKQMEDISRAPTKMSIEFLVYQKSDSPCTPYDQGLDGERAKRIGGAVLMSEWF
jgi:hypothetical protein